MHLCQSCEEVMRCRLFEPASKVNYQTALMELEKSVKSLSLDVLNCEARFSKKYIVHTICGWREIPVFLNLALY